MITKLLYIQTVEEAVVRIVVMANIQLVPPIAYLLQHTTVTYRVEIIKQNKVHGKKSNINCHRYHNAY
jgi:hypothetical protein